ncbi:MAG TPA: YidC/Oxa1 family membrane protein insertase [Chthonomonadales bacterium]|nr:YidC/Oxa1 family membrane protein insertase [Chthonomonadales bacterium]
MPCAWFTHRRSVVPLIRLALLALALIAAGGVPAGAQGAPDPFATALQLERDGRNHEALAEYRRVFSQNQRRDVELAAEALYRGGEYAWKRMATTEASKREGAVMAWQMWKQLRNELPDTVAARRLHEPTATFAAGPMGALEDQIDRENSRDFSYQVIHALVRLTGKHPTFSYAFALILLAVIVKLILLPLTKKQYAGMREMQRMQPLVKELQQKYQRAELQQKIMELYKQNKVNPFASCLPSLLQIPFLIWVFTAIREYEIAFGRGNFLWIGSDLAEAAPRLMNQSIIAHNLASPDIPLLVLYALTNYVTMRMTPATDPQQQEQQKLLALITTVIFFYMFLIYRWSSAFVLYWFALNLLSIYQQYVYIYKPHKVQLATTPGGLTVDIGRDGSGPAPAAPRAVGAQAQPARVRPRKKRK